MSTEVMEPAQHSLDKLSSEQVRSTRHVNQMEIVNLYLINWKHAQRQRPNANTPVGRLQTIFNDCQACFDVRPGTGIGDKPPMFTLNAERANIVRENGGQWILDILANLKAIAEIKGDCSLSAGVLGKFPTSDNKIIADTFETDGIKQLVTDYTKSAGLDEEYKRVKPKK